MKFFNKKAAYPVNDADCLTDCMQFIESGLEDAGVVPKLAIKTQLLCEEMITAMIDHSSGQGDIRINIKKTFGDTGVTISAKGEELDLFGMEGDLAGEIADDAGDEEIQNRIRSIILKSQGENFKYGYKNGINSVRIMAGQTGMTFMQATVAAMVLGLLFGLLCKFVLPEAACTAICTYVLSPVNTVFMDALKIVIAPVVFFSIVTCISGFGDLSELGRIGARVMIMYFFTTVIAILVGFGVSFLLSPGKFGAGLSAASAQAVDINTDVDTSLLHTIMSIVPSNLVRPFLEADTLQLIFLAVLIGVAVGKIGKYTPVLTELFEAFNSLFVTVTTMIAKFIPAAVFCSVALMLIDLGGASFVSVLGFAMANVVTIFVMLIVYGLLVAVLGRVNPITFFRKNREGMLTSFTLCSSAAAMPTNIRTCTDKLGISPKVCNFSIPLGATINMDGVSAELILTALFLAKMYGVTVAPSMMAPLALTVIMLSLGCPGVPGAGLVCMGIVLQQIGVPIAAIGLVIAINPFLDMFVTMSNTTGDVACSLITARKEGLLDEEIFNDMSRI